MEYPSISQLAFSMLRGMTAELAAAVLAVVGTEERFFEMSESELVACSQLSSRFSEEIIETVCCLWLKVNWSLS